MKAWERSLRRVFRKLSYSLFIKSKRILVLDVDVLGNPFCGWEILEGLGQDGTYGISWLQVDNSSSVGSL